MTNPIGDEELGRLMREARESTTANFGTKFGARAMSLSLDVDQKTILRYEAGKTRPPLDRLIIYCSVLRARGLPDAQSFHIISSAYPNETSHLSKFEAGAMNGGSYLGPKQYGAPITSLEMLDRVYEFDRDAYVDERKLKTDDIPFELFRGWWEAHPNGFLCALSNEVPFAVVGLFPVSKEWAESFIARTTSELQLQPGLIAKPSSTCWYFSGLSSSLDRRGLGSHLPSILGFGLARWLDANTSFIRDSEITIVSEGTTDIGSKLLDRAFGFRLESPARSPGEKPRFRKVTTLANIKNMLIGSEFFARTKGLREKVQLGL